MSLEKALIERIRREEFGIGVDLHGEAKTVVANMERKYQSLLSTVAEDLNSKESHFILELIQNADDNSYKAGVDPSLAFSLDGNRIVVKNNEVGFEEKNVRALCSAGESSKKHEKRKGYIGEKGIGFKSLFKVTDTPEIHSNGFHFRFDRSNPEYLLGYVVPHWHDPDIKLDGQTTLVIPAKSGHQFSASTLVDVSGSLLLFLQKLRRLEIEIGGSHSSYQRQDRGAVTTLVTSRSGETPASQDFLRKTYTVDVSDINEPKREGIKETEIVLAFPLDESGKAAPIPGCATYAFLPIRDFGFNFYIQADFVLASSREAIHEELAWNIRLRDGISSAFIDAIEEFKRRPELANTYLKYLPTKEEVHDQFFAPVVDLLIEKLNSTECVPVEGGTWRRPEDVLLACGKIRELFPSDDSLRIFGAGYIAEGFTLPKVARSLLGFKELMTTDVASVFTRHTDWVRSRPEGWKAQFFAYLAAAENRARYVKLLEKSPCIPIEGGELVVPSSGTVFFPLAAGRKYGFERELSILDAELLRQAVEISGDVEKLFSDLGVKQDSPLDLIRYHILKLHTDDSWKHSGSEALIGHVRYIKDKLPQYLAAAVASGQQASSAIAALRDGLYIGTKKNADASWIFDRITQLYLGKEYKPEFDLDSLLGDQLPSEKLVSPDYMRKPRGGAVTETQDQYIADWREFFAKLGVNASPKVVVESSGNVVCSKELECLLKCERVSVRRAVLEVLDRNWAKYPSEVTYTYKIGRNWYRSQTGLVSALRATKVPTSRKIHENLSASYANSSETRSVLGSNVVFVEADLRSTDFMDACGITHRVDAAACLKRLQQMKADDVRSLDQLRRIYRCLEGLWDKERATIESAFTSDRLIRVGGGDSIKWVLPSEACWKQTGSRYLDRLYPALDGGYKDFHGFFVKKLKVPETLSIENWVEALKSLAKVEGDERRDIALSVYRRLSQATDSISRSGGQLFKPPWLSELNLHSLLLNRRGDLVSKTEHFYADDRPEIAKLFEDAEEISFFNVSASQIPSVSALLEALEIKRISDVVKIEVSDGVQGVLNNRLTAKLREMLIPISRIAYSQSHAAFAEGVRCGAFHQLSRTDVLDVEALSLTVTLGEWSRSMSGQSAVRDREILLEAGARSKHDYVAMEVEKILKLRKGASDLIGRVLMEGSAEEANEYLAIKQIPNIPEDEMDELTSSIGRGTGWPVESPDKQSIEPWQDEELSEGPTENESEEANHDRSNATGAAVVGKGADSGLHGKANASNAGASTDHPRSDAISGDRASTAVTKSDDPQDQSGRHKRRPETKSGRLLSYAEPRRPGDATDEDRYRESPALSEHKQLVERAAVAFFNQKAASLWRRLVEMPPNNPGFDFSAEAFDGNNEFIEIKGQSGAWTEEGVALTPTELRAAAQHGEHYWLCVVEYALDEARRRLWMVQDPFGKADQFRFDRGWQDVAEKRADGQLRPEVGRFVSIPDIGKLRILEVMGNGMLTKIKVELQDKSFAIKAFNPARMKVSAD